MKKDKKLNVENIKRGIELLAGLGDLIGTDNTLYSSMIEGANEKINLDLEECLMDEYKREGLIAEVIVQGLLKGTAVDIEDAKRHLKHEHWKGVVAEYAEKMN